MTPFARAGRSLAMFAVLLAAAAIAGAALLPASGGSSPYDATAASLPSNAAALAQLAEIQAAGASGPTPFQARSGDLQITLVPPSNPLPANQAATYRLVVRNQGATALPLSGITLNFDEGRFRRGGSSPEPQGDSLDRVKYRRTYTWPGQSLGPGQSIAVETTLAAIPSPYLDPTSVCFAAISGKSKAEKCERAQVAPSFSNSARWTGGRMPIPYYISDAYRPSSVSAAEFERMVGDAIRAWESTGVVRFEYRGTTSLTPNNPPAGALVVGFYELPAGIVAQASFPCLCDSGVGMWVSAGAASSNHLANTLQHELGHTLGLPHTSNRKSLMYPAAQAKITAPTSADIDALKRLYGG